MIKLALIPHLHMLYRPFHPPVSPPPPLIKTYLITARREPDQLTPHRPRLRAANMALISMFARNSTAYHLFDKTAKGYLKHRANNRDM